MSRIVWATETAPATPSAGFLSVWADSTSGRLCFKDTTGKAYFPGGIYNASIASQGAGFASDTYVTSSDLLIPSAGLQAGMRIRWEISVSKTGAGVATPIYTIRKGAARTTSDTALLAITGPAQTAVIDQAVITVFATLRNVGAAGVLQGTTYMAHNLAATGFATNAAGMVEATSSSFDTTAAGGQYIGLSINGGASAAWTVTQVQSSLEL